MLVVTKLIVRTFDLDHLDISWELGAIDNETLEEYDFYIQRSLDGPAGPFERIAGPFYNTYFFRDPNVHQLNRWRKYFYKLEIIHRESNKSSEHGPAWLQAPPDRIALEVQRREGLVFKEHIGRLVFLYPALTFGQRCRHCWDRGARGNSIGRAKQQNCATCFDTTFVGGYAKPIGIFMQIDPASQATQRSDVNEYQFHETTSRTTAWPPIKTKDLIIEAENRRWKVESMTPTEKLRAIVRQELKLREYPRGDIAYKVPVNFDLLASHSPEREFTRPMTLDYEPPESVGDLVEDGVRNE